MRLLRRTQPLLILAALVLVFGSCTASQPPVFLPTVEAIPGFWKGFWQGFIAPIAFLVSLFTNEVRIYAFPNAGRWYDLGFMLGIGGFSGGVFAGSQSRPKRLEE
jgi:hypothetical protein